MFAKLIDKLDKKDENMKALFAKQDAEIYKEIETHLQPLTLKVKENQEKISPIKVSYDDARPTAREKSMGYPAKFWTDASVDNHRKYLIFLAIPINLLLWGCDRWALCTPLLKN